MAELACVNGEMVSVEDARISIFDRGFLFADGVYEVSSVLDGKLVDHAGHLARLRRSLAALDMPCPWSDAEITRFQHQLIQHNGVEEGIVYLQATRGPAPRDFAYPSDPQPTLVLFSRAQRLIESAKAAAGLSVKTLDDIRWRRRDIKTVGLLAQSMAKQQALNDGYDDAWMVEDGQITEGTSNNAYIVDKDDVIITRPPTHDILRGITREAVLALVKENRLTMHERPFTREEAYAAKEAFSTSASSFVMPVVSIDDHRLGDGKPGPLSRRLREIYIDFARRTGV